MVGRQIVAIGGGGISQDPDNPLLLDHLVGLTGRDRPRVCLLNTASGDREGGLVLAYRAFARRGCVVTHLALFPRERWIPVPASWSPQAKRAMRDATLLAGLISDSDPDERLLLIA